ncbi:MAG: serine/threonine-protein kinase [Kofleriaceae bacterium]
MIAAGQSIGNYRILAKIGTGGMGAVYLAEHPLIGKRVALKVIHRELAGNREVVQRFFQEARAVNTIGNEHIVEIHDFGVTPDGDHFYIMEYLDGRTLASVLAQERVLDSMRALHIGAQIASALGAAHAAGVIHRDLKPDNIMLMTRLGDPDFVKVLDFGLAKMFAEHGSAVKTAAGVLLGTPQYMSPEACESRRDIDYRTDIYALGILLFQMITGVLPFDGQSMGEVLVKQVTSLPPAPRAFNPAIPPSVEQVVLRCLAKQPDQRFPTMYALRDALRDPEAYLRATPPISPARSVANAATIFDPAGAMVAPRQPVLPTGAAVVPGLAPPVEPLNHTMRIATPVGHSSRPARRMWPIVVVLGLVLGLGGGAFAVAWFGRGGQGETSDPAVAGGSGTAPASSPDAAPARAPVPVPVIDAAIAVAAPADAAAVADTAAAADAGPAADAAPAAARTAKLTIESDPAGAAVIAPDGTTLGKTPLKLEWPIGPHAVSFELRLAGYRRRAKDLVVSGNTTIRVELERAPRVAPPVPGGNSDTGLMRPE